MKQGLFVIMKQGLFVIMKQGFFVIMKQGLFVIMKQGLFVIMKQGLFVITKQGLFVKAAPVQGAAGGTRQSALPQTMAGSIFLYTVVCYIAESASKRILCAHLLFLTGA
jgi:hypothetical protein